jgi:tetratricopeptide (TPR) repeat protein
MIPNPNAEKREGVRPQSPRNIYLYTLKIIVIALLFFLPLLIYSNTLQSPFIFDDGHNIQKNHHIRLIRLSWEGIKKAASDSPVSNRPLAYISFALNYFFHSYDVFGYHLVNIAVHLTTGVLLYLLITVTLNLPALKERYGASKWIAYTAALIWLVHPLQTQSVTYIVQRMNSMAAMFYVLSLLFYVHARRKNSYKWLLFAGCIVSGLLAISSKETAATLPLFIFLYEWYFFQNLSQTWLKQHLIHIILTLALLTAVSFLYLGNNPLERLMSDYEFRPFTLSQRLLTQFRVVIFYLSLLVFPHPSRLNLDHDFAVSQSLINPFSTMLALSAIIIFIGIGLFLARREKLISFCIIWFFGTIAIESSIVGLEIIFEHRMYLPSMFAIILMVVLADRYLRSNILKMVIGCSVVAVFAVWTYERNGVWRDEIVFWNDVVKKSPQKARPHNNLGNALKRKGEIDAARKQYNRALQINPAYSKAHNNLGTALAAQGRIEDALVHFTKALEIRPNYAEAYNNVGVTLAGQGKYDEALDYFFQALQIKPAYARVHNNIGAAYVRQGRLRDALNHFQQALRIKPDDVEAYKNLRICLKLIKQTKD